MKLDDEKALDAINYKSTIGISVGVITAFVIVLLWGISIGIGFNRLTNVEAKQEASEQWQKETDKILRDGMTLRIQLQKDVSYVLEEIKSLRDSSQDNSKKLDEINALLTKHILTDTAKSSSFIKPDSLTN